jgi:hypothetical protein
MTPHAPRLSTSVVGIIAFGSVVGSARADCPENAHYVATDGDDAAAGTLEAPWATINYAITVTGAGDCVLVRGGDYSEGGEIWVREGQGGAEGAPWSLEAYADETPILHTRLILQGNHSRVRGLTMASGAPIISWYPATGIEIFDSNFAGSYTYAAIQIAGSDILVEGNTILLENAGGTQDHGIYVLHGDNKVIRNNYISNTPGYGIHVYDEDKYDWSPDISNVMIEGNTIVDNGNRSAFILATSGNTISGVTIQRNVVVNTAGGAVLRSGDLSDVTVRHNTFVDVGYGLSLEQSPGPSGVTVNNNIFWGLGGEAIVLDAGTAMVDHNTWGPGEPSTPDLNPTFADPLVGADFRLAEGSSAIDAGLDLGAPFAGAAPDHGACEFGDESCPSAGAPGMGTDSGGGDDTTGGPGSDDTGAGDSASAGGTAASGGGSDGSDGSGGADSGVASFGGDASVGDATGDDGSLGASGGEVGCGCTGGGGAGGGRC